MKSLVGKNIDIFDKKPDHQRKVIAQMSGQFQTMIEMGGVKFDLMARPVMDGAKRIGTAVEWRDSSNRMAREDAQAQMEAVGRTQAVISFLPNGIILDANENFCSAIGYDLNELVGKHHRIFIDAVEHEGDAYKGFWDALAKGEPQTSKATDEICQLIGRV